MASPGTVGVGIGALALLAFIGVAAAKSKGGSKTSLPAPNDFSPEACQQYKNARGQVAAARASAQGDIVEIDAARIAAAQAGDDAQLANLDSIKARVQQTIAGYNAQLADLNSKIAECEA